MCGGRNCEHVVWSSAFSLNTPCITTESPLISKNQIRTFLCWCLYIQFILFMWQDHCLLRIFRIFQEQKKIKASDQKNHSKRGAVNLRPSHFLPTKSYGVPPHVYAKVSVGIVSQDPPWSSPSCSYLLTTKMPDTLWHPLSLDLNQPIKQQCRHGPADAPLKTETHIHAYWSPSAVLYLQCNFKVKQWVPSFSACNQPFSNHATLASS